MHTHTYKSTQRYTHIYRRTYMYVCVNQTKVKNVDLFFLLL